MAKKPSGHPTSPTILLVDQNNDLRRLEELVLEGSGYRVDATGDASTAVELARQVHPSAIVLGVPYDDPGMIRVVDDLRADLETVAIPVVVVSTSEIRAAEAQASPNVRHTVVAPYDIEALERAVEVALHHPPPPAVLPATQRSVPPEVRFAGLEMTRQARRIVLDALREIRQTEPYRSRFPELSIGLVDDLGTILGAMASGVSSGLTPTEVLCVPEIHSSIAGHVQLRKSQGLGAASAILEDQILESQIARFLASLVGTSGFTAADAFATAQVVREYIAELIRIIVLEYAQ